MSIQLSGGTYNLTTTTTTTNQEFDFDGLVLNSILIRAVGNVMTVKFNLESYEHVIAVDSALSFDSTRIKKVTVLESGKSFIIQGTHY
jgi:hypothetical protein